MKWVRLAVTIGSDPSVGAIADALGVRRPHAVGLCTLVFAQMPEHARAGDLSGVSDSTLESWAGWHGKRGAFATAFRAELCTPEGIVKAWEKHNGAAIREADATRERVRSLREKAKSTENVRRTVGSTYTSDGTGRDVTETTKSGAVDLREGERRPHSRVDNRAAAATAPLVASATRNGNSGTAPLPFHATKLLRSCYGTAPQKRQDDVRHQLEATLRGGAIFERGQRVQAVDVDHLDEACRRVVANPPAKHDAAIRLVLIKLRESYGETKAARDKAHRAEPPRRRVEGSGPTPIASAVKAAVA